VSRIGAHRAAGVPGARRPSAAERAAGDLVVEARDLSLRFGGVTSLDGVSLRQRRGEILAVIGPNGAGKTSLFNCLTGAYRPQQGSVTFWPEPGRPTELVGRRPHAITRLGVARTFQNIRLFPALSALENVQIGTEMRHRYGPLSVMLGLPHARSAERDGMRRAGELLDLVGLAHRAHELAASLPYGEQRRLEIARALGTGPSLLLLDEPAAGTNPAEKRDLAGLITRIAGTGVSVLLIEHDMGLVMSLATSVVVLNFGRTIAHGTPGEVQRSPAVIEAYLGAADATASADATARADAGARADDAGARKDVR
jgi:branched-chain amino acid transport system ATP-binding protein